MRDSYGAHFSLHFSSKSLPPRFSTQFSNLLHVKRPRKRNKLYRDLLQMETLNVRKRWHSTRFCPCFTRTSRLMPMKGLKNSTLLRCRRHKHGAILRRSHDDDFVCFCDSRDPTRAVHRPLLPAAVFLKLHPTIAGNKRAANNHLSRAVMSTTYCRKKYYENFCHYPFKPQDKCSPLAQAETTCAKHKNKT